ncbi:MAG: heme-binding protein [Planctomycetaceae bacterium]|nr:heme-binding protein [Planctomycetales bacterium]MCB9875483.1 heme-binding protein [Planctomycetaceae bacterium]
MFRSEIQRLAIRAWSIVLLVLVGATTAAGQTNSFTAASNDGQPLVRTNRAQLTLAGAERAVVASRKQAEVMGVQVNIAVVDDGGHLLAFARMDGARPGSVYTSITKATSAATKRGATGPLPSADAVDAHLSLAVENAAAVSGGKFTTLKGGLPIMYNDQVIGAIGVGGATGEQDAEVAATGVAELSKAFASTPQSD